MINKSYFQETRIYYVLLDYWLDIICFEGFLCQLHNKQFIALFAKYCLLHSMCQNRLSLTKTRDKNCVILFAERCHLLNSTFSCHPEWLPRSPISETTSNYWEVLCCWATLSYWLRKQLTFEHLMAY